MSAIRGHGPAANAALGGLIDMSSLFAQQGTTPSTSSAKDTALAEEEQAVRRGQLEIEGLADEERDDPHDGSDNEQDPDITQNLGSTTPQTSRTQSTVSGSTFRATPEVVREFSEAATLARLDADSRAMGLAYCDAVYRRMNPHISMPDLILQLQQHQSLKNTILSGLAATNANVKLTVTALQTASAKTTSPKEFKDWVRDSAAVLVVVDDLPAYTAAKMQGNFLPDTFTKRIWIAALAKPDEWKDRCLGPGFTLRSTTKNGSPAYKTVMDLARTARSKLQAVVIEAIPNKGDPEPACFPSVPTADTMIFNLFDTLGNLNGVGLVREEVQPR